MPKKISWKQAAEKRAGKFYSAWPHVCATHENFYNLSTTSKALLFELLGQYRGFNNGDLCCAWGLLRNRGWKSRATIERARNELLEKGWIVLTRQGGRNKPNLYALTFFSVDECKGKLDNNWMVGSYLGYWKKGNHPGVK